MSSAMGSDLPTYIHTVEVWVEEQEGRLGAEQRIRLLLTSLFQWMRVGEIVNVSRGPSRGDPMLRFDIKMTCPPHQLDDSVVYMRVSNARRVESESPPDAKPGPGS